MAKDTLRLVLPLSDSRMALSSSSTEETAGVTGDEATASGEATPLLRASLLLRGAKRLRGESAADLQTDRGSGWRLSFSRRQRLRLRRFFSSLPVFPPRTF
ncbi:hypothetical protein TGFOU_405880 [Toxoplasma gondii FOU]|uniref:Uncharacterized protein n=1 Tax=Toxoplasma gondii FOU TaxID=943167 RepID=A0A086K255_TOXGO|nr:hypothetical protein TGFOU_405880 [Toxoplasma gondii FOU]